MDDEPEASDGQPRVERKSSPDGVVDGMHFELALTPGEVRAYDWETPIQEEAEMNKQLEALVARADEIKER